MMSPVTNPRSRASLSLALLVAFHVLVIIASNYLVQLPISLFGFHSTWGAFSFPFIFLATDLTVRLIGKQAARSVIARTMLPALVASYIVSVLFHDGAFSGFAALGEFNSFVFRIALASFAAYVLGQLLDIQVFDRIRRGNVAWWVAPTASGIVGQALDTAAFFSIAFWRSSNPFMAANWVEIAVVDYFIKLAVSLLMFVPLYGIMLNAILRSFKQEKLAGSAA
ncbi:putative integral membrane protein (TIGR00697 family) [Kerstersia gyiorum]|nr:putative integral membrane protein (TIGR00697 family) [Kerstersia gyiorum]MCP1637907.1 putative integral membrane protein (TIGR00697 family) [Kerstersia gyiorum]MCP1672411.1 putative integral membrane protein (TIGR00697 family) [Kerstersia gyiorum]MCP1680491.1 putative integral membrane protein (TIGR00697 family) [Kerstersia gyiorum]MCP1683634.1 putative integral membrane protein (TIGR00697 family) [Kerstersia gyiorum]